MSNTIEQCRALLNTRSNLLAAYDDFLRSNGCDYRAGQLVDRAALATLATHRALYLDDAIEMDKQGALRLLSSAAYALQRCGIQGIPAASLAIDTAIDSVFAECAENEVLNEEYTR
jgi:hypothetical protein